MLRLFSDNLLPVFLATAAGYLIAANGRVKPQSLAHVAFFILAPCLIFRIISDSRLGGGELLQMSGFVMASLLALAGLAALACRLLGLSRTMTAAVVLVVLLPNAGNLGLSVSQFAFGDAGLAHASLYFVSSSILTYTAGVFVASMGRTSLGEAARGLLKVPAIWAVVAGFLMVQFDARLPTPVDRTVRLLADGCIPVFLLVLGMQLRQAKWGGKLRAIGAATSLRLGGGIAVALALAPLFQLAGTARQAAILESAMPSAVITIILATEYDVEPDFVTSVVLTTTVLSPLTLTPILAYLS